MQENGQEIGKTYREKLVRFNPMNLDENLTNKTFSDRDVNDDARGSEKRHFN